MGIGRRKFLQLIGATASALILSPGTAVALHNNTYINRKLGIAFEKPNGWHFSDVKEMGEVAAGQLHATDDESWMQYFAEQPLPILTVGREKLGTTNRFTPGITIFLDKIESKESSSFLAENCDWDFAQMNQMFKHLTLLEDKSELSISECDAMEYSVRFLFEHERIEPAYVRMRSVVVNHHPAYYTFRMFDSPFMGNEFEHSYDSFLSCVKLI